MHSLGFCGRIEMSLCLYYWLSEQRQKRNMQKPTRRPDGGWSLPPYDKVLICEILFVMLGSVWTAEKLQALADILTYTGIERK